MYHGIWQLIVGWGDHGVVNTTVLASMSWTRIVAAATTAAAAARSSVESGTLNGVLCDDERRFALVQRSIVNCIWNHVNPLPMPFIRHEVNNEVQLPLQRRRSAVTIINVTAAPFGDGRRTIDSRLKPSFPVVGFTFSDAALAFSCPLKDRTVDSRLCVRLREA